MQLLIRNDCLACTSSLDSFNYKVGSLVPFVYSQDKKKLERVKISLLGQVSHFPWANLLCVTNCSVYNKQCTNLHLQTRQVWGKYMSVHLFLPTYQAWVNTAPVCPFWDSNVTGMQGLEMSSAGMWHHPAPAALFQLSVLTAPWGFWEQAQGIQQQCRVQISAALAACCHPSALPKRAQAPSQLLQLPGSAVNPGKENWFSLEKRILHSHSQWRYRQIRLSAEMGITRRCQPIVYDTNLLPKIKSTGQPIWPEHLPCSPWAKDISNPKLKDRKDTPGKGQSKYNLWGR